MMMTTRSAYLCPNRGSSVTVICRDAASRHPRLTRVRCRDDSKQQPSDAPNVSQKGQKRLQQLREIFSPFHEDSANTRFLALTLGGMLCSIATLIHDSYLPIFMREELGLNNAKIGSVQALSQLLCQFSKGFSGVIGDLLGSQVKILVFGTALTAVCKPMFAGSSLVFASFGAAACLWCITVGKMMDRVSKGFRDAPTKALISQTAKAAGESSDAAFSVRQSLATVGSLLGSAIASATFYLTGQSYVLTFAAASVPPVLALLWLSLSFRSELLSGRRGGSDLPAPAPLPSPHPGPPSQPSPAADAPRDKPGPSYTWWQKGRRLVAAFKPAYWQALAVVAVLYFGRFDFSFVTLRAKTCLVPKTMLPLLGSITMLATTLSALTIGRYAKGRGVAVRNRLLLIGFAMLVVANCLLAAPFSANAAGMAAACAFIGLHMGMTHGLTLSMVSSYMPHEDIPGIGKISGTAWSFTDAVLGVILALSNTFAGLLTDATEKMALQNIGCFGGGACGALLSGLLLLLFMTKGDLGKELNLPSR